MDKQSVLRMSIGSEIPDVRSRHGHTERPLSFLSACPWNKQAQSVSGP